MIISVASGKGGTGKTTVAVNLALSVPGARILDCDVEEPNAHIFIKPVIKNRRKVYIPVPQVDEAKCRACGRCQEVCAYNAIAVVKGKVLIFTELCHGCGSCVYFCPEKAMGETHKEVGCVEIGESNGLPFVHGKLNIGEAMAPPVIKAVQSHIDPSGVNIIDAPPGTSCPVITAVRGTDLCLLVTEPTPFGLNDLKLAVEVVRKLSIPFAAVINRSDLGDEKTDHYCKNENIPVLMRIPFRREIAAAYSRGDLIIDVLPEFKAQFQNMFKAVQAAVKGIRGKTVTNSSSAAQEASGEVSK